MGRRIIVISTLGALFALFSTGVALAQPDNDDFGNATVVPGLPFTDTVVDMDDATVEDEDGEPIETCAPFANTVWYAFTPEVAGNVSVDTAGSDFDTTLAVWTGSGLTELDLVACNDDPFTGGLQARLAFAAETGVTYFVQAGAFGEAPPGATLEIAFDEAPKPTGKPGIFKSSFRGMSAQAFTDEFTGDCFTSNSVFLTEGRTKIHQERPFRSAELFVASFSECFNEEFTFVEWFGSTLLDPEQFAIDGRLRNAWVDATLDLFGFECSESEPEEFEDGFAYEVECMELGPETVDVFVQWTGEGPLFRSRFSEFFSTEGFRVRFTNRSISREATVEGEASNTLIAFSLDDAQGFLSKDGFSEMFVVRNGGFFPF